MTMRIYPDELAHFGILGMKTLKLDEDTWLILSVSVGYENLQ